MAETRTSLITLGLCEIKVGVAAPDGTMPTEMTKIGKTYKDTCKIAQDAAEVTEHFEEGVAAPEVRKKTRKIPKLTFSIMDANVDDLVAYVGGENIDGAWGYNGDEVVANKAIRVVTEKGLDTPPDFACYCFKTIYTYVKEKMQYIKDNAIKLDTLNPGIRRTLKRCFSVSDQNVDNIIAEKFV